MFFFNFFFKPIQIRKLIWFDFYLSQAFSAAPLLVYPTHYTGELGYISDTESSEIVPEEIRINSAPGKGSKESIAIEADLPVDLATPAAAVVDNLQLDEIRSEL